MKAVSAVRRGLSTLTRDNYPHVKRGDFGTLTDRHVQEFERILDKNRVISEPDDLVGYNQDWLKAFKGESKVVLRPRTTDEVSSILKVCHSSKLAVCPQGGNTGLVGGSVPVFDEVILSMNLMNKIIEIDPISSVVSCEAGCVLEQVNTAIAAHGMMMPYDLGSKGSCQIGGNISTCAGGLRLIRYGSMLGNTLGIQVVLSNGKVLDIMNTLKKDNTGYHLRQLFVGSEGTLGVVTKATIQCPPSPNAVNLAFLGVNGYKEVVGTYMKAKRSLSEILSSCEMMDSFSMNAVEKGLDMKSPVGHYPFYMVIETHGSDQNHDEEKITRFLEEAMKEGLVKDGTMATEPSRIQELWKIRESIVEGLIRLGNLYTYDITMPVARCYEIVELLSKHLEGTSATSVSGFGHIGDGNIHLNVLSDQFDSNLMEKIENFVYPWISDQKGSISAEHGIGFRKIQKIQYGKPEAAIALMKDIKKAMDPLGILNPYKVLPLANK